MAATDGSSGADRAIDVAARLAKATGGKLAIVTIQDNLSADEMTRLARAEGNINDALEAMSAQLLRAAKGRAHKIGAPHIETEIGWGDPAEALIDIAKRRNVEAIVVGRRGRGRLAGLLLGSVSQKLVSLAPFVVVVVP